jgi:hypothetical protein
MMQTIDPETHMVVDLRSCSEIDGAAAVDLITNEVVVLERKDDSKDHQKQYDRKTVQFPSGVRVARRR